MQDAGLDVSVRETTICVIEADDEVTWEGKVATDVAEVSEALSRHAPNLAKAGMETGPVAVWLWHALRNCGVPLDCIHARRAAAALKLQTNKTDRNDARGLAQLVRSGRYDPVSMKSMETYRVRAVLVARDQLVRMITALINKIRGLAKTFGIIIGTGKSGSFERGAGSLTGSLIASRALIEPVVF